MKLLLLAGACCALLFAQTGPGDALSSIPVSGICGLVGYDVSTLASASYWVFAAASEKCILAGNQTVSNVSYCEFYVSVCHQLAQQQNPTSHANLSVVQKVYLNDGTTAVYALGNYSKESAGHLANSSDVDDFYTTWEGPVDASSPCGGTVPLVEITYRCDQSANWNPNNKNVTSHVIEIIPSLEDRCLYIVRVNYAGACYMQPTVSPSNCHLDGFDVESLSKQLAWTATAHEAACYDSQKNPNVGCYYFFAFCQPLTPNITNKCEGASVCQSADLATGEAVSFSLGHYFNYTIFRENEDKNNPGFYVDYHNGTITDNCTSGLRSRIVFLCNTSANWSKSIDISAYTHVAEPDDCEYMIYLQYSGACVNATLYPAMGEKTSFVGWIFIAIFLFVALTYFTVGAAYNYFRVGARGLQIIPQYEMWQNFTLLILEGCKYSLDVITCFRFDGTPRTKVEYDRI